MSEKKDLNRADQVRIRRERENQQRRQRAATEATRTAPVQRRTRQEVVQPKRNATRAAQPRNTRKPQGGRRRFHIALLPVAPDAEMRGFSVSRPQLGRRLPSFLLATLLGAALYFAFNLPQLRVTQAQVSGNQIVAAEEINAAMKIHGEPVFLLMPSKLETELRLSFPEFVAVNVDVTLPNSVSVQVEERKPVIRWEQGPSYTWIAEDGIAFRPRGEVQGLIPVMAVSAPPIEANVSPDPLTPAPFISADMVHAIQGLASHVPAGVTILYDQTFGFGWNDPRGWSVYFGTRGTDVELKMRVYDSMVSSLAQRGIQPVLINVTYPSAPYYRLSQ
jgi:hypothetical protein